MSGRTGIPGHTPKSGSNFFRIGAIGREIGAQFAARKCNDYGRRRGGVVVIVDTGGVCWALMAGTVESAHVIERQTSSVVGTFYPGADRTIISEIRDGIRERMRELGAVEWAA